MLNRSKCQIIRVNLHEGGAMQKESKKLLTLKECEERTKRKVSTWRKAIARREIPFVRIGRSVRIPQEVIEEIVQKGWCEPVKSPVS